MLLQRTKWARRFEAAGYITAGIGFLAMAWPVALVSLACLPAMLIAEKVER